MGKIASGMREEDRLEESRYSSRSSEWKAENPRAVWTWFPNDEELRLLSSSPRAREEP